MSFGNPQVKSAQGSSVAPTPLGPSPVSGSGNPLGLPFWSPNTQYDATSMVQVGGVIYLSTSIGKFTSAATFGADSANWTPVSLTELGYQSKSDGNFSTAGSVAALDVTGLTALQVTTNGRPFYVCMDLEYQNSAAFGGSFSLVRTTDATTVLQAGVGPGPAGVLQHIHREVRQALAAGTYNYKLVAQSANAGNNLIVLTAAGAASSIYAIQV